ncbi:hypothetical protein [Micromonospora sp. S4605]|uniref:hypothetical protein n=1 Tax=Micromonospora sp. S4605 TaxID=1420897 RepID=UPI001305270E|nr:hypothetical protein [Micromonospora sp. S4605]
MTYAATRTPMWKISLIWQLRELTLEVAARLGSSGLSVGIDDPWLLGGCSDIGELIRT